MMQELDEKEVLEVEVEQFPDEIEVHVTEEDISEGCEIDSQACMVARAFRRLYPDAHITTGNWQTIISEDDNWAAYGHPVETGMAITRFDKGEYVEPFSFTAKLDEASTAAKLGGAYQ